MVFQDESKVIVESAINPKLTGSSHKTSSAMQPCFHPSCSHCDENFLNSIKSEIKQLTSETELLKLPTIDPSVYAPFETQRSHFYAIIDEWKSDRIEHISFIYQKKKNQIDLICSQTSHEYETFKIEQKSLFNENLSFHNHRRQQQQQQQQNNTVIPDEIEQLNQKLSLTRHLLDYFIQPKFNCPNSFSDDDDDDDDEQLPIDYEPILKKEPINEYALTTDNLAMACSNSHVLLRDGARLLLFNEKEKLHQLEIKVTHPGDFVRDLCWCSTLGCYLVLTQYLLFVYDPEKHSLTLIDKVQPIDRLKFSSLTCSDNIMFLVNGNGQCIERWLIGTHLQYKLIKRTTPFSLRTLTLTLRQTSLAFSSHRLARKRILPRELPFNVTNPCEPSNTR